MSYFGNFESNDDIIREFQISEDVLQDVNVLIAAYDIPSYEGYAFVLFERCGLLYEVHGYHCSCYGLENQWEPEMTTWRDLQFRLENGRDFGSYGADFASAIESLIISRLG
jgi:hypothetical protein